MSFWWYIVLFFVFSMVWHGVIKALNTLEDKDLQKDVDDLQHDISSALTRASLCNFIDYIIDFKTKKDKTDCINVKFQNKRAYKQKSYFAVNVANIQNDNWYLVRPNLSTEPSFFYEKDYFDFHHTKKDYQVRVYFISTTWLLDVIGDNVKEGYKIGSRR